ncbi:MAG: serine/threonine protein kinase [Gemmatimonadetes bacterium]|nr:serine/threonine protein kinase [Gemmatimonadota bacterium]
MVRRAGSRGLPTTLLALLATGCGDTFDLGPPPVPIPEMVSIAAGQFVAGSPESAAVRDSDETQHVVTLTRGYLFGATEVTQELWELVMGSNPSLRWRCGADCPVDNVSWLDALLFCNELSRHHGFEAAYEIEGDQVTWIERSDGYRLPTEAEWEYACRAGTESDFFDGAITAPFGCTVLDPVLDQIGWYCPNGGSTTHPVGLKTPNAWDLYDTAGNVSEWCWDRFGAYPVGPVTDPAGPDTGASRVRRGGSWSEAARDCRSADRSPVDPEVRSYNLGLRLARFGS